MIRHSPVDNMANCHTPGGKLTVRTILIEEMASRSMGPDNIMMDVLGSVMIDGPGSVIIASLDPGDNDNLRPGDSGLHSLHLYSAYFDIPTDLMIDAPGDAVVDGPGDVILNGLGDVIIQWSG